MLVTHAAWSTLLGWSHVTVTPCMPDHCYPRLKLLSISFNAIKRAPQIHTCITLDYRWWRCTYPRWYLMLTLWLLLRLLLRLPLLLARRRAEVVVWRGGCAAASSESVARRREARGGRRRPQLQSLHPVRPDRGLTGRLRRRKRHVGRWRRNRRRRR